MGILEVDFNMEVFLGIAVVVSAAFALLLFLIKVPHTEHSYKLRQAKTIIAVCYLICTWLFTYAFQRYIRITDSTVYDCDVFAAYMMLIATAFVSCIISYAMINLLDPKSLDNDRVYLNVGLVAVSSIILERSFWWEGELGWKIAIFVISIVLFIIQCVILIIFFNRVYKKSLKQLEDYYDEDQVAKVRWVRFIYVITMLTQSFVLVYMFLPKGFMRIYTAWYSIYLLYFTSNFISFLGSHKLLLDAFAHGTLSGRDLNLPKLSSKEPLPAEARLSDKELRKLERNVHKWVEAKKYCESDLNREQIAEQLQTTKEYMNIYFTSVVGQDFRTWRTQLRVEEAKEMLLDKKELSLNLVAELCGFSDRSNFHRQFTRYVGCSPKEWRDSNGQPSD